MQNSLDRIFDGLQHTLRSVVAPAVADAYLRTQITAVAEIVGNLSTRVEWSCAQLLEVILRVRPILELAGAAGLPVTAAVLEYPAPTAESPNAELVESRDAHLLALREVQHRLEAAPDERIDARIREFLAWQVDRESTLLRTGLFSAPRPTSEERT